MPLHSNRDAFHNKQRQKTEAENIPGGENTSIAYNTHLLSMLFMLLCFLFFAVMGFVLEEVVPAIIFLCLCPLPIFCFLISPLYVIFTEQEITIVYFWGIKERIAWRQIRHIEERGSWFHKHSCLPEYHIAYPKAEKYPFFADGSIPKTRKIKKMMERFYRM